MLSEALDAVAKMLDAIPNGRASITNGYIGNLAALLCQYPRLIALRCADPLHGVILKSPFVPTPHDVVKFCEPMNDEMSHIVRREDLIAKQLRERAEWERSHPQVAKPSVIPKKDEKGRYPVGSILSNYDEAVRLYGRPIGAFEEGRNSPYSASTPAPSEGDR